MRSVNRAHARSRPASAPLVIAHRGACGYLPEHTLEAYQAAIAMGADFIEPDLVATQDGHLIARHEPNLADSTDVAAHPEFAQRFKTCSIDGVASEGWFACDFSLAEIKTLRARQVHAAREQRFNDLFQIPTYDEILALAKTQSQALGRTIGTYPETKHPSYHASLGLALEEPLLALLAKHGYDDASAPVIIQSLEVGNLQSLRSRTPLRLVQLLGAATERADGSLLWTAHQRQPYDWVLSGETRGFADLLRPEGLAFIKSYADGIGPWKGHIVPTMAGADGVRTLLLATPLVEQAHQMGLLVHAWTFRNEVQYLAQDYAASAEAEYQRFFALGVDGVFSDFADTAVRVRDAFVAASAVG